MELFYDGVTKDSINKENMRVACRGIVKKDNLYLMVHLKKTDIYTFPGGGILSGESLDECAKREVLEETGIKVKNLKLKMSVTEYFIDSTWTNHYFTCEIEDMSNSQDLTDEEKELELEVVWKTEEEIFDIFENNMTLHEQGPQVHKREFFGFINSL